MIRAVFAFVVLLGAGMLATGCASDRHEPANPGEDDSAPGVWVSLQIGFKEESGTSGAMARAASNNATYASPLPGNWGDGKEPGIWNEYFIEDLNIFFFKEGEEKLGLDQAEATLLNHKWVSKADLDGPDGVPATDDDPLKYVDHIYEYKYKVSGDIEPETGDFVVVVANYGESLESVTKLSELRDKTAEHSWRPGFAIEDNCWFLMSNAYNNQFDKKLNRLDVKAGVAPENVGKKDFPFTAQIYLQRAAARIDLLYDDTNLPANTDIYGSQLENAGSLVYKVKNGNAIVELTHIYPVNVRQKGTYIFKHLTEDTKLPWTPYTSYAVAGDEKVITDASGNRVPGNYVVDCMSRYKTMTGIQASTLASDSWYGATARQKYIDDFKAGSDAAMFPAAKGIASILNAHTPLNAEEDGFDNASVITYAEENTQGVDADIADYATGLLLRAVYHPKNVYASVDGYGNPTDVTGNYAYRGDLWRYIPNITEETGSDGLYDGKALYFSNEAAALAYQSANSTQSGTITHFWNGICYYNIWIRHVGVEDGIYDRPIPMEFGIVRNNLYRISFTFHGPGTPDLEIREPYNVRPRIFVQPWTVRRHPVIIV